MVKRSHILVNDMATRGRGQPKGDPTKVPETPKVPSTVQDAENTTAAVQPDASRPPSTALEERTDSLEATLRSFMHSQQKQQDRWEAETQRQEQRWKTLSHQFQQLQTLVSTKRPDQTPSGQTSAQLQDPVSPTHSTEVPFLSRHDSNSPVPDIPSQGTPFPPVHMGWTAPKMPSFDEEDDIEHYLTTFERIALASQWPMDMWALYLVPLLRGKARAAYVAMDIIDSRDYVKVKQAILRKMEINAETYRLGFRSMSIREGETARELQSRLKDLYEKWLNPKQKSKEEIGEQIILEQFLRMLNPELRVWVKEHNPQTSKEAADLAETFIAARRTSKGYQLGTQGSGGKPQGPPRDTKKPSYGKSAGDARVFNRSNSFPSQNSAAVRPKVICHSCGQPGHIKPECPVNKVTDSRLFFCPGSRDVRSVMSTDAIVPVKVKGKTWQALIDSGSSQTFIRRACLFPEEVTNIGKIRVRCIHGDETEYPTVSTTIEIQGQKYLLTVGVMDTCPYPVILGQDVPVLAELLQGCEVTAQSYVTTRAQARENLDQSWEVLPYACEQTRERVKKTKSQKRRDKVRGTSFQEQLMYPPLNDSDIEVVDIAKLQREDITLGSCYKDVKTYEEALREKEDGNVCFAMRNGKLVRVSVDTEQLVVPEILRTRVLHLGHSIPWAGHLGQEKTEERIGSRFYWPGLHRAVVEYCKSCPECQLVVRSKRGMKAPLINLPVIDIPFTRIAMDVVGPLEKSRGGHRYILVVCDYATRYPEAFPLRHIKARQVANCLLQLFSRVGIPKEILTDQGTNFNSKFLKQVYTLLGIQGIKTTPYHPQTDGMVERFNQTLKSMLRKFVSDSGADWDQWLPYLLFAYREVPQASTGYSPFELLYGREVRGPLDVLRESWEGDASQQQTNIVSYVLKMREKLDQLSTLAHDNQIRSQSRQKTWYDRNARLRTFQPGQKVLLLLPSSESSLLAKWQGPFEVLRKLGQVTYEIAMPGRRQPQQVFHVNLLKQWNERSVPINEQRWACVVEEEEELKEQYFPTTKGKSVFPSVAHLSSEHQKELLHIIPKALFREEPGRTELITHDIRLKSAGPIRQTTCRVPARLIPALKQEVQVMLEMGIIEPSHSEWCSPVVLVPKKDGGLRFCVDFSKLNSISAFDPYPMPRVDELVERLGKARYLSTLDLCKGYWQVPLAPEARELTAFRAPSGLFHFNVMPFGLHGAAATFQRLMDQVLRGAEEFSAAYIDDVVIFSTSWDEHLRHLRDVFRRIRQAGLVVNASKCQLAQAEVYYLGYILGGGTIKPQVSKVSAIRDCQPPTTKRGVRSFLGLVGWYRRFIPHFSSRATALSELTKKSSPNKVVWTETCDQAFQDLKKSMCQGPVLQSPDFELPFTVQTDASGVGLGAVLLQGEGVDRKPVQYISRKLFPRETRYSTVEKECLAMKWALDTLKYYLLGKEFVLETDHRALQWLHRMRDSNARITRWHLSLQPYKFVVKFRAGKDNVLADFLSRRYVE